MINLIHHLKKRKEEGLLRSLSTSFEEIDFCSNDYLGLAKSENLQDLTYKLFSNPFFRNGSTGSRLITGNYPLIEELEKEIASFHDFENGLLFPSGYMANFALIDCLADASTILIMDSHIHASFKKGAQKCKASVFYFRHNDVVHLEKRLRNCNKNAYVAVESLYSMDGSFAPLKEINELCQKYEAKLIVDEAHATGVFGSNGKGLSSDQNISKQVFAQVHSFGKALGLQGAIILGNSTLKQYLINFSSPFIYSTGLAPLLVSAIMASYQLFPSMEKEREQIRILIKHWKNLSENSSFKSASESCIQPISVSGQNEALFLSQFLKKQGYEIKPILSPTVAKNKEILRLSLHAFNELSEVEALFFAIEQFKKEWVE